ncbi:hypothetical protein NE237_005605 [Protea cynaroides]|uniref:Uncharacterized protein n=1 Tax=Protea cynaroides TaxID=273540 RepID=A0A9Q0JSD8_9MAGN|nr:hypothetical protein NE237_005605 [Protea cynaroides]
MLPSIKTLELKFVQCNEMVLEKVSDLLSLSSLYMEGISNLSLLPNGFFQHLTTLQELEIHDFNEMMTMVGLQHLTSLERLVISKCPKLVSLTNNEEEEERDQGRLLPSCLKYLELYNCDNLKKLAQSLCNLHCLTEIIIEGATGLACLPKELLTLTSLHKLSIYNCPSSMSLVEMKLPIGLQSLHISNCSNLQRLTLSSCPSLVSLAEMKLPIGLQFLNIVKCNNLKSLPDELHSLTSLIELQIKECPALESFPDIQLPTMLQKVHIQNCGKLNSPPKGLYELKNLKELRIEECSFLTEGKNIENDEMWSMNAVQGNRAFLL